MASMKDNLLVLLPRINDRITIRKLQKAHLAATGDGSFYALPPVIIIGRTERKGFDRKKFNIELVFDKKATRTEFGYLLLCDLSKLQEKYSATGPSGLFFTYDKEPEEVALPPLRSFSLALLEASSDGYLLLQ